MDVVEAEIKALKDEIKMLNQRLDVLESNYRMDHVTYGTYCSPSFGDCGLDELVSPFHHDRGRD